MAIVIDGTVDFSGGQNAGLTSDRIQKNQFWAGVNITSKNGSLGPRPPFRHIPIKVITPGVELGIPYQEIFDKGKFQGERAFLADQRSYVYTVRSGIIFKVDYQLGIATVLRTATDDRIQMVHRRVNIAPAGKYTVIFDWPNMPVIILDDIARRSNFYALDAEGLPSPQVPQSRLGVFVQSRLWVANSTNEFTAGDFVGDLKNPDAPITFKEVFTPGAPYPGQAFNLGYGFGNMQISAMGFISSRNAQSQNQATEYGPLYVATRKSVSFYSAENERASWAQTKFGRLELWGTGIVGQRAHTIIGADVIFQSPNSTLHSLTKNQNDERSGWATTIISREVQNWLDTVNGEYLDIGFVTYHDRNVFVGARPMKVAIQGYHRELVYDYCHQGLVTLELDNVSSISGPAAPTWAGLWTGLRPMEATEVDDELYITSKDIDGFNRTYLLDTKSIYDSWNNYTRKIKGRVYLRTYDHEKPFSDKKETSLDVNIGNIIGDLTLTTYRKPLHLPNFGKWGTYEYVEKCDDECKPGEGFSPNAPLGIRNLSFGDPVEDLCSLATGESGSYYREVQVLLEFEGGKWQIDKVKLAADEQPQTNAPGTPCTSKVKRQPKEPCNWVSDWDLYYVVPKAGEKL